MEERRSLRARVLSPARLLSPAIVRLFRVGLLLAAALSGAFTTSADVPRRLKGAESAGSLHLADATSAAPGGSPAVPPQPATREILVSRQLLEARGLSVGDEVSLSVDPKGAEPVSFRIAGVYEPTPDPMRLSVKRWEVRLHLPDLIGMTADPSDPGAVETVSAVHVSLRDPAEADRFAQDVQARLPGLIALPVGSTEESAVFVVLQRFHLAIAFVTVLGSSAFLMALMVMRADERRETVGILRLIGLSRRRILLEVLLEGLLIAAVGAVFGVLFAAAVQGIVNRVFQWHYDTALVFLRVTGPIAARCVILAIPVGVLAGLVASWTLLRREISVLVRR